MKRRQYDLRKIKGKRLNFDEFPDLNPDLTAQVRDLQQQLEALRSNVPGNWDETTRAHTRTSVH